MVDLSIANSGSLPEGRWRMFQCHVWWHQMSSYPMTGPISKFKWWLQKFGKDISKISPQFAFGIESRWSYIYIYSSSPSLAPKRVPRRLDVSWWVVFFQIDQDLCSERGLKFCDYPRRPSCFSAATQLSYPLDKFNWEHRESTATRAYQIDKYILHHLQDVEKK